MTRSKVRQSPRSSVEAESKRRGEAAFIAGCMDLLAGGEADPDLIVALGLGPARWATEGGDPGPAYWLRVWATRGLLWVWDDKATPSVLNALHDDAWRVREMAAKVVARHRLESALPAIADLQTDENSRVRRVAERALVRLTDSRT